MSAEDSRTSLLYKSILKYCIGQLGELNIVLVFYKSFSLSLACNISHDCVVMQGRSLVYVRL